jgi:Domain of unknown function (DUF4190)
MALSSGHHRTSDRRASDVTTPDHPGPEDAVPGAPAPGYQTPGDSAAQAGIPNSYPPYGPYPPGPYAPQGQYPPGPPPQPGWNQQMPYVGQSGYPYAPYNPYGYVPQRGTSGLAIASLITGICGFFCVTPLVSIGLGIAALSDIGKSGRPGKGMAIAGIVLSGLWIALFVLLVTSHHAIFTTDTPQPSTQNPNGTSA